MGMLPSPRVTPPFSNCGVNYAGPSVLQKGKQQNAQNTKAYICLFVCFAPKAIHLELTDLSSELFLATLKRFISRKESPVNIHSDNDICANFKGGLRQLDEFYKF